MQNETQNYCNAKTRGGGNCKNPAGLRTSHPGIGRCYLHGGCSTGPSQAGKAKSSQNARKHGLYAKVLTGSDLVRYQAVQEYDPGEILRDNFYLIQARVLGLLEGEGQFSKDAKTLLNACAILVENEEISQDFVDELRSRLLGLDVEKMAKILNSTTSLANAAVHLDKMGDVKRQLDIAKGFIVNILRSSQDQTARQLAIATISELKLEAGLPSDELDELLKVATEESDYEVPEEEAQDPSTSSGQRSMQETQDQEDTQQQEEV